MNVFARFWIKQQDKSFLGVGRIELLEKIRDSGSISKAAKQMGMSYKAAWDSVDTMNKLSDEPLIKRSNGGRYGGGSVLTSKGLEAIEIFKDIERVKNLMFNHLDNAKDFNELKERLSEIESSLKNFKK